jgi:hypothetical protein
MVDFFFLHKMLFNLLEMRLFCHNWGNNFMDLISNKESLLTSALVDALPSHGGETPSEGLTKSSCGIETW